MDDSDAELDGMDDAAAMMLEVVDDADEIGILLMATQETHSRVIPTIGFIAAACSTMSSENVQHGDRERECQEDNEPKKKKSRRKSRAKHSRPDETKLQICMREVHMKSDAEFFRYLHVTKPTFAFLHALVDRHYNPASQPGTQYLIDSRSILTLALRYFAGNCTYMDISRDLQTSLSTVYVYVQVVVQILCVVAPQFLHWPRHNQIPEVEAGFKRVGGLDGVVGVLGGCHIKIRTPSIESLKYHDKHSEAAMHLLAVCDHTSAFTYVNVGQPGSAEEGEVLKSTSFYRVMEKQPNTLFPSDHLHVVAGLAYPGSRHLRVPIQDTGPLSAEEKKFNQRLLQTQTVIKRVFMLLVARFRRLNFIDGEVKRIPNLVKACCILHNITLRFPEEQAALAGNTAFTMGSELCSEDALSLHSVMNQEQNEMPDNKLSLPSTQ